jgi:hypothetical protein
MADFEGFQITFYFLFAFAADGIGIAISVMAAQRRWCLWNAAGQI